MPFPTIKLASIILRQASKYVANFAKRRAKESPTVRGILVRSAQSYHKLQTTSRINLLGLGKVKKVAPLSEEAAIDLGTDIIGDLVLIALAYGIYVFIENRSSRSKEAEEDLKEGEMNDLKKTVQDQGAQLIKQSVKIRELEHLIRERSVLYDSLKNDAKFETEKIKIKL